MWFPSLGLSAPLIGLAAQVPLYSSEPSTYHASLSETAEDFQFKQGPNVFSPYDMAELARPGVAVVNPTGDLLLVPVTQFSLQDKTCVNYQVNSRVYRVLTSCVAQELVDLVSGTDGVERSTTGNTPHW